MVHGEQMRAFKVCAGAGVLGVEHMKGRKDIGAKSRRTDKSSWMVSCSPSLPTKVGLLYHAPLPSLAFVCSLPI